MANRRIRLRHRAGNREKQRDSVLGRCHDVSAGRIDDENPVPGRGRHVDVVDADTRTPHDAQPLTGFEHRGGDLRLAADNERVEVADPLHELGLAQLCGHDHLAFAPQACEAVLGQWVCHEYPGHRNGV